MKLRLLAFLLLSGMIISLQSFQYSSPNVTGAWHLQQGTMEEVLVFEDGYFSYSIFDKANKKFIGTYGGVYKTSGKELQVKIEFDNRDKENIGMDKKYNHAIGNDKLTTDINGINKEWKRLDNGTDNLAGVWRITGRRVDGKLNEMRRGDRKTLKLLSSTRFQWMAINPATKEFFGTGGGTYTFVNGKYTEHIEFFSRDSTRIGASLSFDGKVKDGTWNHSGKSSKGDPIDEVWTKEKY